MKLPPEVRCNVLGPLVEKTYLPVFLRGRYGPRTGMTLPNIACTTKILRAEYMKVALERTIFSIHRGDGNQQFQLWLGRLALSTVSSYTNGFDAIKALDFPFFSRFPHHNPLITANNDIELMVRCKNPESVRMTWAGSVLIEPNSSAYVGETVQRLRTEYRLDRMLVLEKLRRLQLCRWNMNSVAQDAFERLVEWFRESLKKDAAGRAPEVVIV